MHLTNWPPERPPLSTPGCLEHSSCRLPGPLQTGFESCPQEGVLCARAALAGMLAAGVIAYEQSVSLLFLPSNQASGEHLALCTALGVHWAVLIWARHRCA
jgi:hypothetical protein